MNTLLASWIFFLVMSIIAIIIVIMVNFLHKKSHEMSPQEHLNALIKYLKENENGYMTNKLKKLKNKLPED